MSTSDVGVTSTDRFSFSLFLALMLHAALILGIGFSSGINGFSSGSKGLSSGIIGLPSGINGLHQASKGPSVT